MPDGMFRIQGRPLIAGANGSFSAWLARQLTTHAFCVGQGYAPPSAIYVALYVAPPNNTGGGVEVSSDPVYVRQLVTFPPATGNPASASNLTTLNWATATQDWGAVAAAGLFDAALGGNFLAYGLMLMADGVTPTSKVVQAGDLFQIMAGSLQVGIA
jgi:hypothetical protein